jgi:hypothetical protein
MFGETPLPPLDLSHDRVLGHVIDDHQEVLLSVRRGPG